MPSTGARERVLVPLAAAFVATLSVAPRIILAGGSLPSALRPFIWSDVLFTYERGLTGHRLPYLDTPFEYPPLVGILSGIFSLATDRPAVYVALWGLVIVAAATATAAILARAAGPRRALLYFALTPELLLLSGINFDLLATGFFAVALVAARAGREALSIASLGLGTTAKLFPAAAAPLAILRGRNPFMLGALFAGVVAALYAATSLGARGAASSSVGFYVFGIAPNLDSPWGILARALEAAGVSAAGALVLVVTLVGLAVTYALAIARRVRTADPIVLYALAVLTLMLWSRLYSPQYSLWALPVFVLLPLGGRLFALLAAADTLVFLTIYPLTLVRWSPDDLVPTLLLGLLVIGVGARHLALVLCWRAVRRLSA